MKQHQKKNLALLLVAVLLVSTMGCSQKASSSRSEIDKSESSGASVVSRQESVLDTYYPHTASAVWLGDEETLAVPNGNTIRYLDMNNHVKKTVELPKESIIGDCRYFFASNRIFAMGGYDAENYPGNLTALLLDGTWELTNGAIFDGDGKLLHAFPRYTETQMPDEATRRTLSDGRTLPAEGVKQSTLESVGWVTDDLVVLNGNNRLFFYRLSTDTLTLADDMSEWMEKYGKSSVYYGVEQVFPYGEGAFYFVHKNEEKSNNVGTVWYADESGAKELFVGQEFQNCIGNETMLVMVAYEGETEETRQARVFYARTDDLALQELGMDVSWMNPSSRLNGSLASLEASSIGQPQSAEFYLLDAENGALDRFVPPQAQQQCSLLGAWREADGFEYIYSVFDSAAGTNAYYRYHSASGQTEQLTCAPEISGDQSYSAHLNYYVEYSPTLYESVELRIRPLE